MSGDIRALSVRQPWTSLILSGYKDIENRSWSSEYRGVLVLHAGTRPIRELMGEVADLPLHGTATGAFLGTVRLAGVHHAQTCRCRCSTWAEPDQYHWELSRPCVFVRPRSGAGSLRLFVPPDVVRTAAAS